MNVSLSGIPLGEWRDLTDDELIDLFKLIERSSSEAKPKAKAKPKTTGIKRPVVAIEKAMRKRARHQAVSALPRRDARRKDVNVCRASAYSPTRRMTLPYRVYTPAFFFNWRAFFRFSLTQRHQLIDVLLFYAVGLRIGQRTTVRNTGAVQQRFQFALFALGHLFLGNAGSAIRVPSVSRWV